MNRHETGAPGLWERTRRAVHCEIAETAMRLFLEQGFDATTIDQIAREAGISRRSFFRYFGTKEDIVLGDLTAQGVIVQAALEARPLSEPPWQALRAALGTLQGLGYSPETTLKISKMLYETPSLRARSIEKHLHWQELLMPNIERRLGVEAGDATDPRARAIVACALACLDAAGEMWTRSEGAVGLDQIFDAAVAAVRR